MSFELVAPDSFVDTRRTISFQLSNNGTLLGKMLRKRGFSGVSEITSLKKDQRIIAKERWNDHRRRMIQEHVVEERP